MSYTLFLMNCISVVLVSTLLIFCTGTVTKSTAEMLKWLLILPHLCYCLLGFTKPTGIGVARKILQKGPTGSSHWEGEFLSVSFCRCTSKGAVVEPQSQVRAVIWVSWYMLTKWNNAKAADTGQGATKYSTNVTSFPAPTPPALFHFVNHCPRSSAGNTTAN